MLRNLNSITRKFHIGAVLFFIVYGCSISQPAKTITEPEPIVTTQPLSDTVKKIAWPLAEIKDSLRIFFNTKNKPKATATYQENLNHWYARNEYQPLWHNSEQVAAGIRLLQNAANNGLNPSHYKVESLNALFQQTQADSLAGLNDRLKLELELSLQVKRYARHLYLGKLNPKNYHSSWNYPQKNWSTKENLVLQLIQKQETAAIEELLAPAYDSYPVLKQKLVTYSQNLATNSTTRPINYPGKPIKLGNTGNAVSELKQRLGIKETNSLYLFDSTLLVAVKAFQESHGLTPDGVAGPATYQFLNWTTQRYIDALKVNMERLRWLPDSLPATRIEINLPAFELVMTDKHAGVFRNKIIIGTPKHFSPVFQSRLNVLVFNPCWTIPQSIATKKLLPKIQKDPSYLKTRNMFVAVDEVPIPTDSIDFSTFTASNFPYKIYQNSGPGNALGVVKFLFDNPYHIYLHDTPQKNLFNADKRAFSHGCIRVKNPLQLAQHLLDMQQTSYGTKEFYLSKKYPVKVPLKTSVPICIQYLTANTGKTKDSVYFFNDVYGLDLRVLIDLEKP
ncbi:MAG: murein L,D-transpeptidase [Salinivirgaceae bacterium]